jgi:predicted metalloprotease with PDZ domain
MNRLIAIMLLALIVSAPAMAGGAGCDGSADEVAKMEAKYAEKPWLGVEYDKTDNGEYVITKVMSGSPAEEAGFQKGDTLLTMQGVKYTKANKKALKKVYADISPGSEVQYVVKRQGAKVELDATLAHVPADLQKKWIAEHMQKHHPETQVAVNN